MQHNNWNHKWKYFCLGFFYFEYIFVHFRMSISELQNVLVVLSLFWPQHSFCSPQFCVQPDDHVLQRDLRWSKEHHDLQWKNNWPSIQRCILWSNHKLLCRILNIYYSFHIIVLLSFIFQNLKTLFPIF